MRKLFTFSLAFLLLLNISAKADEGMWLLTLLNKNYEDMKKQGFKLTPEDIYNVNKASLKDAIVVFGGFCTGEIISPKGLILTNHHCGYGAIQQHSTVEHDYLKDGFWAKSFKEEIPTPGLFVMFLVSIEDVSGDVLKGVDYKMSQADREAAIRKNIKKIEGKHEKSDKKNQYSSRVRSFFNGNAYYLLTYQTYNDVRLVGTPPESIGKFGHDTDNWMWPRHTGDFSMFRVYMSPEGKPAEYSEKNVPFKPKHFLPVSIEGYKKNDFAMVLGYPGGTDRYMTSYGIDELMQITNVNRAKIRGIRQEIMLADMEASDEVRIKYSSKYAGSSNYWKYSIGQNKGLKALKVADKKKATEEKFTKWVETDKDRKEIYGEALNLIKSAYNGRKEYVYANQYISECLTRGTEFIGFAGRINTLYKVLKGENKKVKEADAIKGFKRRADRFFKNYNTPTDKKIAVEMFKLFVEDVDSKHYPTIFNEIKEKYNNDFEKYINDIFQNSIFVDKDKMDAFLKKPTAKALESDIAFKAAQSIYAKFYEYRVASNKYNEDLEIGRRLFLDGLMKMNPEKNFYPDANFTMRLTYGTVGDYSPRDAVDYEHYTTAEGILEKEDPDNFEFVVDPKLKKLIKNKDFGRYADNGEMRVCFTTNNDITGGNSGSPVINGEGELIGLAFDGNWEAMSGDIAFEPDLQKCINVDIRYVLFIIDKFAGAQNLIDEMKIVE